VNWGLNPFPFLSPLFASPPFLSPFPSFTLFSPFSSLFSKVQLGGLRSAVSSPSGVWGGVPAEMEFGALYLSHIDPLATSLIIIFPRIK